MTTPDFEDRLKRSLNAKASPTFLVRLGEELHDRHGFQKKRHFRGIFRLVFASILLVTILAISVDPPFGDGPISAQAFVEAAYETYEMEATLSGVYYQKTLYRFRDSEGIRETINKEWIDPKGNRVYSEGNPQTEEPYFMELSLINEEGRQEFYRAPDEPDPYVQGSYHCVYEDNILQVAAQDPSMVTMYREEILNPNEEEAPEESPLVSAPDEGEQAYNDLEKARTHSEEAKAILEELKSDPAIHYEEVEEEGEKYYLFVVPLYFNTDDDMYYYFSAETYRLDHIERYEHSDGNHLAFRLDYLESRYLTEEEAEGVFDPKTYGAVLIPPFSPFETRLSESMEENACYDPEENRLTIEEEEELWNRLSLQTRNTFNEMKTQEEMPVYEEDSSLNNEPLELEDHSLEAYIQWISTPLNAQSARSPRAPSAYEVDSTFEIPKNYLYLAKNPTNFLTLYKWTDPTGSLFYLQSTEVDTNCLPSQECILKEQWYGPFVGAL